MSSKYFMVNLKKGGEVPRIDAFLRAIRSHSLLGF
jgi:hypothetical protein